MKRLLLLTLSLILALVFSATAGPMLPVPGSPATGSAAFGAADEKLLERIARRLALVPEVRSA